MLNSLILGFALLFLTTSANAAATPPSGLVNETTGHQCAVSYVDKRAGRVFTAGHCGSTGDKMRVFGRYGEFYSAGDHGEKDWGYVSIPRYALLPHRQVAWSPSVPPIGTTVCFQSKLYGVRCGKVQTSTDAMFTADPSATGVKGDSGTPAILNGRVVGIYTGMRVKEDGLMEAVFVRPPVLKQTARLDSGLSSLSSLPLWFK